MKRMMAVVVTILFLGTGALRAQDANPFSTHLKGQWANIRDLLVKMADRMPEENYRFKPTPELQDFGERMAHVVTFNMRGCSAVKGEQKPLTFSKPPTKAEVAAAMKQTNDECDSVFNSLTDADLTKMVTVGRGAPRSEFAVLEALVLEHAQEVYGYSAVYLRLKGLVPPSSDRNEK
jgi:DinB superfamily